VIELALGCARVVFTDRHGGVSSAPFASMNLAGHVDDDPAAVEENFARLAAQLGLVEPSAWARPFHVHGTRVLEVDAAPPARAEADGSATIAAGLPVVALGADCAPIALANDTAVAAIHAGWRGALDGVVEAGVAAVRRLGTGPVRAAIGPCICVRHYEFGVDALAPLTTRFGQSVAGATNEGAPAFDLPRALHLALYDAGVDEVIDLQTCTVESGDHFSYRRDRRTGRQGVVVVKETSA
jgi:purine-nucleoside/S-methyl-5'-thioadenosine phosphorylase / adenosine deaminase